MGDEVTKKDLQTLQVSVSKKITDLDTKVSKAMAEDNTGYNKLIEQINKYVAELQKASTEHGTAIDAHAKFLTEVKNVVNQHSKDIAALK